MTNKLIEAADELRIFTTSNRGINYDLLDALKRNPLIISAGDNISGKAHETIVHQRSTIARLESELTARESAGEVEVKPLSWECASLNGYKRGRYAARSVIGNGWAAYIKRVYDGWEYGGRTYLSVLDGLDVALDAAQIQAQADYETRIRSALAE